MPDLKRWADRKSYLPWWEERAAIIGGYLADCESVLDMGADTQTLRQFVTGRYIPLDCVSLSDDAMLVDLDSEWSASDLPEAEGVAMAGLLEHVSDPVAVIRRVAPVGRVWAVSYMDSRRHQGHKLLTLEQLESEFAAAGMCVDQSCDWMGQRVYRLVRC